MQPLPAQLLRRAGRLQFAGLVAAIVAGGETSSAAPRRRVVTACFVCAPQHYCMITTLTSSRSR